jgi:hypothetical protein
MLDCENQWMQQQEPEWGGRGNDRSIEKRKSGDMKLLTIGSLYAAM